MFHLENTELYKKESYYILNTEHGRSIKTSPNHFHHCPTRWTQVKGHQRYLSPDHHANDLVRALRFLELVYGLLWSLMKVVPEEDRWMVVQRARIAGRYRSVPSLTAPGALRPLQTEEKEGYFLRRGEIVLLHNCRHSL